MAIKKHRAALVGWGNIGRHALQALQAAEDFEVAGVVRRSGSADGDPALEGLRVVDSIAALEGVEVAILAVPSRKVEACALECIRLGINTVDSFDIHSGTVALRRVLAAEGRQHGTASIISAGWDPGSDSIVRALFCAMAPKGVTYTNFGPGMSMGHSVAVKAIPGVRDALSVTIPLGTGIHRRLVYVEMLDGYDFASVAAAVKADPYFVHDETFVEQVPSVAALKDMGHGVNLVRKGVSGETHNQRLELNMSINNPALTGQILVAAARAVFSLQPGAYTMIEVPVIDFLPGDREELIASLV